jgi:uncharacterized membrane protein YjjB (DUF3815 family)
MVALVALLVMLAAAAAAIAAAAVATAAVVMQRRRPVPAVVAEVAARVRSIALTAAVVARAW